MQKLIYPWYQGFHIAIQDLLLFCIGWIIRKCTIQCSQDHCFYKKCLGKFEAGLNNYILFLYFFFCRKAHENPETEEAAEEPLMESAGNTDGLDARIESFLREWHHSPDLLFSIHPVDGSFLIW